MSLPYNTYHFRKNGVAKLLSDLDTQSKPPPFLNPVDYIELTHGIKLDAWQKQYANESTETSRIAIAACRQSGKSTVTAGFAAWYMTYMPGKLVLVASKSLRQAAYFVAKIRQAVLHHFPRNTLIESNKLSLVLPNGSTVVAIPCQNPDAGRGFSPDLVILDEAAFAAEDLLAVLTPSLAATHGALHMISSPNGPSGFFYDACEGDASQVFMHMQITHEHCPRITKEFLASERITLGELRFNQEYNAQFLAPEGAFFGAGALNALFAGEDIDLAGLELDEAAEKLDMMPSAEMADLMAALDRTDRVRRMLYE